MLRTGGPDTVNLYNGNLGLTMPLGPQLHPGADVRWQLRLHYDSHSWVMKVRENCSDTVGYLRGTPWPGLGWSLQPPHLAIEAHEDSPDYGRPRAIILEDGSEVRLRPSMTEWQPEGTDAADWYSADGSGWRVHRVGAGDTATYEGYHAGLVWVFDRKVVNPALGVDRDFAMDRQGYYPTSLRSARWGDDGDPGPRLEFSYGSGSTATQVRTITEVPSQPGAPYRMVTISTSDQTVSFEVHEGAKTTKILTYQLTVAHGSVALTTSCETSGFSLLQQVSLLTGGGNPDLENDLVWSFSYSPAWWDPDNVESSFLLTDVVLPTGAHIHYDYGEYEFALPAMTVPSTGSPGCLEEKVPSRYDPSGPCQEWPQFRTTLGVTGRKVFSRDGATLMEWQEILDTAGHLRVSAFHPGQSPGFLDLGGTPAEVEAGSAGAPVYPFVTGRVVRRHLVAGEDAQAPDPPPAGSNVGFPGTHRYDDILYLLLEGHVVVDKDGDLDISGGDDRGELPLAGYPLRIVRFRGPAPDDWVAGAHVEGAAGGDPRAVTVFSYTVEPPSSSLEDDTATAHGVLSGYRGEKPAHVRVRARAVVHRGEGEVGSGTGWPYSTVRFSYETDPGESGDVAYPWNVTRTVRDAWFRRWPAGGTVPSEWSQPGPEVTTTVTTFAKAPALEDRWLTASPATVRLYDADGVLVRETDYAYGNIRGELTARTRVNVNAPANDEVVQVEEAFEYQGASGADGYGQVLRKTLTLVTSDSREEDRDIRWVYQNQEPSEEWIVCPGRHVLRSGTSQIDMCPGWGTHDVNGDQVVSELAWRRVIDPGLRLPVAEMDANGYGVHRTLDPLGRVLEEQPWHDDAEDDLEPTIVTRPDPNTIEISRGSTVVEHRELDALGRTVHVARRLPATTSTAYVEGDFTHRTAAYDGTGAVVALSEWEAVPNWNFSGQVTLVKSRDPLGMVEEVDHADGSATLRTVLSAFAGFGSGDGACRLLSEVVRPAGGGESTNQVRRLTFVDALGQTRRILEDTTPTVSLTVNGDHDPWQQAAADLVEDGFVVRDRDYDGAGELTDESVTGYGGISFRDPILTQHRGMTYNGLGWLLTETRPELPGIAVKHERFLASGWPIRLLYEEPKGRITNSYAVDTYPDAAGRPLVAWIDWNTGNGWNWYELWENQYGTSAPEIGRVVSATRINHFDLSANGNLQQLGDVTVTRDYTHGGPGNTLTSWTESLNLEGWPSANGELTGSLAYDRYGHVEREDYPVMPVTPDGITLDIFPSWDAAGLVGIGWMPHGVKCGKCVPTPAMSGLTYSSNGSLFGYRLTLGDFVDQSLEQTVDQDGALQRPQRLQAWVQAENGARQVVYDTGQMSYDVVGNLAGVAGSAVTPAASYSYDALGRLIQAQVGSEGRAYRYDQFGNLTASGGASIAVDHETNRLGGADYSPWGTLERRLEGSGWWRHTQHDLTGALTGVWGSESEKSPPPPDTCAFVTGPDGDRTAVIRLDTARGGIQDIRWEVRDLDGNLLVEYLWTAAAGWQVASQWVYLGRVPVLRLEKGVAHALVRDHLGSVRADVWIDEDGQPVIQRADYWPYGEVIAPTLAPSEGHRYTAQWREYRGTVSGASVLDGLDFMHAREYDWRRGRFLEPDPIGSSWNAYAYALGSR